LDWQKTSSVGAFVVATVWGSVQFYIWYKHGEIGMSGLLGFGLLVCLLFISAVLNIKATRANSGLVEPRDNIVLPTAPTIIRQADERAPEISSPTVLEDNRVVVGTNPERLCAFFKDATTAQGKRLVQPYIGKWMRVSGKVSNVGDSHISFRNFGVAGVLIIMFFDDKWSDRISVLEMGTTVTVLGQIREIDVLGLQLRNCELVS
jgi:hypothetical protein